LARGFCKTCFWGEPPPPLCCVCPPFFFWGVGWVWVLGCPPRCWGPLFCFVFFFFFFFCLLPFFGDWFCLLGFNFFFGGLAGLSEKNLSFLFCGGSIGLRFFASPLPCLFCFVFRVGGVWGWFLCAGGGTGCVVLCFGGWTSSRPPPRFLWVGVSSWRALGCCFCFCLQCSLPHHGGLGPFGGSVLYVLLVGGVARGLPFL